MFVIIKRTLQNPQKYEFTLMGGMKDPWYNNVMRLIVNLKRYMKEYDWCKSMKGYCVMCI